MAKSKLPLLLSGFFLLLVLAILGISIASLVTLLNVQTTQNNNIVLPSDIPPNNGSNLNLNIPKLKQISQKDNSDKFSAYQDVVTLLKTGLDTTVSPCDDFYQYTCGNWGSAPMSFDVTDTDNYHKIAQQLDDTAYISKSSQPVQLLAYFYGECKKAHSNWDAVIADGHVAINAIAGLGQGDMGPDGNLMNDTVFPFPMWDGNDVTSFPTDRGLGYLIGYAAGAVGMPTIVSPYVDTNWKDPHGNYGYAFYIDQPTTFYPNTYYQKTWDTTRPGLIAGIIATMNNLAKSQNKALDPAQLSADATAIADFDYMLAMNFSTDDTTRRQYNRNYNPYNIKQLKDKYPQINWHVLVPEAAQASFAAQNVLLGTPYSYFSVMEEDMLSKLLNALQDGNVYGITPRTLVNYIYYRVLDAYSDYIPQPADSVKLRPHYEFRVNKGKPRSGIIPKLPRERKDAPDPDDLLMECVDETVWSFSYANTRVFIDKIYPTDSDKKAIHTNMAALTSSILAGFRSMIDELNWMTDGTKTGAYSKIDNLVKNIAYPDWVLSDDQLTNYYNGLQMNNTMSYLDMQAALNTFNIKTMWDYIAAGSSDRQDFSGPSATTNAWYQPEMNSITFPAAILRQPFYDPNWPASMNFGGLGVVAGHELTHGFDDEGVQWDGTGVLFNWMDDKSNKGFTNMAKCVIDEYSGFCPLDPAQYGAPCVDGAQTQGENIADNGGIHSAFRAYRNYIDLYGPDPLLPDDLVSGFTGDQLFFLSFAQVWCQAPPSDARLERQLLVDVHSPSQYRVFGTIQNFPAFKDAFQCPSSNYAPDKHCNVWVSDVTPSYGEPQPKNDINTLDNKPITTNDVTKYNAYTDAVNFYKYAVDTTADPCNDYWKYACGNYNKSVSFHFADANNNVRFAQQLTDPAYQSTIQSSTALTKEKQFFDNCVYVYQHDIANQTLVSKNYVKAKMDNLEGLLGSSFSLLTNKPTTKPNPKQLAQGLAFLSFSEGTDTFVTPMVDTYWKDPKTGYQFFVDQNTAQYSKSYYPDKAFQQIKQNYINSATNVIRNYAIEQGIDVPANLTDRVTVLVEFEQVIANSYSTDDTTRRQYDRSWNQQKATDMNAAYPFIDWNAYLAMSPAVSNSKLTDPNYQVVVMEVGQTAAMSRDYLAGANRFSSDNIVNYLNMRLLMSNAMYLPSYKAAVAGMYQEPKSFLSSKRRDRRVPRPRAAAHPASADITDVQSSCASRANGLMQFANGRVFVDLLYPDQASKDAIRQNAGGIITNIITSFQGMLDQLDWMDDATRPSALQKTVDIVKNIAFPDWITDNVQLDAYYADLQFVDSDDYFSMYDKLSKYNIMLQYRYLTYTTYDRTDFLGQPGTVNAWYQPELNSITFPAGILQQPYFDPNWPASVNYGGMGLVAGHELTHGFDDEGVQWDSVGKLANWMSNDSRKSFDDMAACVINEYNQFCPLDNNTYYPNCVNGEQTQGENIADNGGVHAAFNAYRTHIALDGPDPLLPDRLFGQMSHDQLFFLNFAQVWCEARRSDDDLYTQLMVDPHSPSQYRVFGTIQNFPAFRVAYNCPVGSDYSPKDYCKVWVPNWMA